MPTQSLPDDSVKDRINLVPRHAVHISNGHKTGSIAISSFTHLIVIPNMISSGSLVTRGHRVVNKVSLRKIPPVPLWSLDDTS